LIVIPPIEKLDGKDISSYRQSIKSLVPYLYAKLCPSGLLAIGCTDIREENGKLWPLSMIILEDIQKLIPDNQLKLKELLIAVPEGYSKNPKNPDLFVNYEENCILDNELPQLPIVHIYYKVFMKLE